ncbi:hypothetical protein PVAG01_01623 [Phlyctema vagabunda]|uniref:Uncharacterized protein n=1 Tax=Phlyctema vagabunda TaxID=108571 RepID=A0ABR4PXL6_9HELO
MASYVIRPRAFKMFLRLAIRSYPVDTDVLDPAQAARNQRRRKKKRRIQSFTQNVLQFVVNLSLAAIILAHGAVILVHAVTCATRIAKLNALTLNAHRDVLRPVNRDLCQICCDREDVRVNSHSTKTYSEIDLDTTPIIALRCGHLFSVAYLDEVVCIDHVYHRNDSGDVAALRDTSSTISAFLPCCPECQRPFQRYFVRRYNRIVNKVLNDECALSFLKSENVSIQSLEIELQKFELGLLASRVTTLELLQLAKTLNGGDLDPKKRQEVWTTIYKRYVQYEILRKLISSAKARANESFQSSRIVQLEKAVSDVSDKSLSNLRPSLLERQASTPVQLTGLKAIHTTLIDELQILGELKSTETGATIKVPSPVERGRGFLQMCMAFTKDANDSRLLGQCVKAIILYASVVRPLEAYCRMCNEYSEEEMLYVEKAQTLVEHASKLTKQRFYNSDLLNGAIETLRVHLQKKWYEDVDSDEKSAVEAILKSAFEPGKNASLVGGLWYRCENGHMFPSESTEDEVLCMECGVKV